MTEGTFFPGARVVVRALLAALIGMLAGGGLNAALGEQGADTPALALLGGARLDPTPAVNRLPVQHLTWLRSADPCRSLGRPTSGVGGPKAQSACRFGLSGSTMVTIAVNSD